MSFEETKEEILIRMRQDLAFLGLAICWSEEDLKREPSGETKHLLDALCTVLDFLAKKTKEDKKQSGGAE